MKLSTQKINAIHPDFYHFINTELLPKTNLEQDTFWNDFMTLIDDLSPLNNKFIAKRANFQQQINQWHIKHKCKAFDSTAYQKFLT